MIEAEKISFKKAKKRVKENLTILLNGEHSLKSIFEISFSRESFTLFNIVKNNSLKEITYGEAKDKIKRFAAYFKSNIDKNERYVGLLLENSPEWIYSLYGLLMAGFSPVLLSTKEKIENNLQIMKNLNSSTFITDLNVKAVCINPYTVRLNEKLENLVWADEIVFITSGTSGNSKVIKYTGEELTQQIVNASGIVNNYPLIASTYNGYLKHLVILPLYHVFGFIAVFLWFSFFNTTFVLPSSLASNKVREAAIIGEPTHIFAVPLFWDTVAKGIEYVVKEKKATKKFNKGMRLSRFIQKVMPKRGPRFVKNKLFSKYLDQIFGKSIQFCITGGSYISENTLKVINGIGYPLVNGFGSTEIGISSFANPKNIKSRVTNTIGKPFDGFKYQLGNNHELLVNGNSLYHSMLQDGEFIKRDKEEFLHTADVAMIKDSKFYIKGRMDDIFIGNNGENLSLVSVEQHFHPVYASDVVALQSTSRDLGKHLVLLLAFNESCSDFQIAYDVKAIYKNPDYTREQIHGVYIYKHEVEKANGLKVKRNLLQKMLDEKDKEILFAPSEEYLADDQETSVDEKIANYIITKMKDLTHAEKVDLKSDFFTDLGGDSLSYYELISNLEAYFGVKFDLNQALNRTPAQFAVKIMERI